MKTFLEMALLPGLSYQERRHYIRIHLGCNRQYLATSVLASYGFHDD